MQRTFGVLMVAGLLALTACSPGEDVSQDTAVPTASTAPSSSDASSTAGNDTTADSTTTSLTVESSSASSSASADETVALPGLLDPSDDPIENDDDVRTGTLDNGLTYYIRHNERPGAQASLRLAIRAGSVDEFGDHTGVAHFVEHMMFNGTEEFPKNELVDVLRGYGASFGADINAYTTFDET